MNDYSSLCIKQVEEIGTVYTHCSMSGRFHGYNKSNNCSSFTFSDILDDKLSVIVPPNIDASRFNNQNVRIMNPYCGFWNDGTLAIYITDPEAEIVLIDDPLPKTSSQWLAAGKAFYVTKFSQKAAIEASIACWTKCIASEENKVSILLSNRSAAHLALNHHASAARDAWAASQIDPANLKACYRLAKAMKQLNKAEIAQSLAQNGKMKWPDTKEFDSILDEEAPKMIEPLLSCWWEIGEFQKAVEESCEAPPKETISDSWENFKVQGNKEFKSRNYVSAINNYTSAMHFCSLDLSEILCLRSTALLQLDKAEESLINSTVAVIVDGGNPKCWQRRAFALERLDHDDCALKCCDIGMSLGGTDVMFHQVKTRIAKKSSSSDKKENCEEFKRPRTTTKEKSKLSTEEQKRLQNENQYPKGNDASIREVELLNVRFEKQVLPNKRKQIEVFGGVIKPVEDFRLDILNAEGSWPLGVDPEFANTYLNKAYVNQRFLPYTTSVLVLSESYSPFPDDLLKRLGAPQRLEWWTSACLGDICPDYNISHYSHYVTHSFSNQSYRPEVLLRGGTHVAVGFVDLGILLVCRLHEQSESVNEPLKFVGYERSAYCVAKSIVIWQMFKNAPSNKKEQNKHCVSILQVWFSATWSPKTVECFREACKKALQERSANDDVTEIIRHWTQSNGVPLCKARKCWEESRSRVPLVGLLLPVHERVALAKYELTGDFGLQSLSNASGSIVMFDCPDGTAPLSKDETVFSVVRFMELMSGKKENETVVDAVKHFLLSKIHLLMNRFQDGSITVELHNKCVEDAINEISHENPLSMSWSNLWDFMEPSEFHRLARQCSINGNTAHFGYSMNWLMSVKGTNIMDYPDPADRKRIIQMSSEATSKMYSQVGAGRLLKVPPPNHVFNTTTYALQQTQYETWTEWWTKTAQDSGHCRLIQKELALDNPLSPTGSFSIYFTWTYDSTMIVKFNTENK